MGEYPKVEVREGRALVLIPDLSRYMVSGRPEPAHAPVFYNPRMEVNRSVSVAILNAYMDYVGGGNAVVCEPLSGTGVRSIRYALEVRGISRVVANDISSEAVNLMRTNVELNGLNNVVSVNHDDANHLLLELARSGGCDVIDIDPFGSPQPFIENSLRAIKNNGLLCVTATDVGVLSGKYPLKCVRRYGALPRKFPFRFEVGIRILIGSLVRYALSMDYGVKPLVSYMDGHYYRVCALIVKDRSAALESLGNMGFAYYSPSTLDRGFIQGFPMPGSTKRQLAGPLWIGPLWDYEFLIKHLGNYVMDYFSDRARELITALINESSAPNVPYALTTELTRELGRELPINDLLGMIRGLGYHAVRTHFHVKGFRTDMNLERLRDLLVGK
ncbi:methyltransferase domain-containing protein [Vulcanisaeta thermophila]|uniref:methyltransferase domain-containing protein n=1 Tax=Vulcanisaeta thermophila TaxID=867917 RepID=UPI0008531073|nr:tRNA (guanine(26)-N(2))-dimethyltransferase [Vulcanisaeta thermophila]